MLIGKRFMKSVKRIPHPPEEQFFRPKDDRREAPLAEEFIPP